MNENKFVEKILKYRGRPHKPKKQSLLSKKTSLIRSSYYEWRLKKLDKKLNRFLEDKISIIIQNTSEETRLLDRSDFIIYYKKKYLRTKLRLYENG